RWHTLLRQGLVLRLGKLPDVRNALPDGRGEVERLVERKLEHLGKPEVGRFPCRARLDQLRTLVVSRYTRAQQVELGLRTHLVCKLCLAERAFRLNQRRFGDCNEAAGEQRVVIGFSYVQLNLRALCGYLQVCRTLPRKCRTVQSREAPARPDVLSELNTERNRVLGGENASDVAECVIAAGLRRWIRIRLRISAA